jgi:FKBP-type peptidyl-prolyl cis-trans isomerase
MPLALLLTLACGRSEDGHDLEAEGPREEVVSSVTAVAGPRTVDRGSGCLVDVIVEGKGRELAAGDEVIFAYEARVCGADAPFASTREWTQPCTAKLDTTGHPPLIAGLVRGLIGLTIGTKARIEVPAELAYGKEGLPSAGIPADAALVFDVEVLGIR